MIISITSSDDIGLEDVEVASEIIAKEAHPDATIIWGVSFDDMLDDEMVVSVVATGFGEDGARADTEAAPSAKPAAAKSTFEEAMEKGAAAVEAEGKDPKAEIGRAHV